MNVFEFVIFALLRVIGFIFRVFWAAMVFAAAIWADILLNLAPRD